MAAAEAVPTPDPDGGDTLRTRILLGLNRWVFAAGILAIAYAGLILAAMIDLSPIETVIANQNATQTLFAAYIGALITGTAIVVTINQLVLSQELGAMGKQRDRMESAMQFREDVAESIHIDVSSPDPAAFLSDLLEGIDRAADATAAAADHDEVFEQYAAGISAATSAVSGKLSGAEFGTFAVVDGALSFDYSVAIYGAKRLRAEHIDGDSEEVRERLDDLIHLLEFYGPVREHFKTLYFQWTLIDLSRALLYMLVPALVVMSAFVLYVDEGAVTGTTLGVEHLVWLISAGVVVGMAPFVIFIVFILRIATVAKRTLAMGAFVLQ